MGTFVIGECCSAWRFGADRLANAYRLINAVKACGADAAKFQWTSDVNEMAARRHGKPSEFEILAWPADWIPLLKAKCDEVGIEFMCTVFLAKDIPTIAPFVKRFKVAAAESSDVAFIEAHLDYAADEQKRIVVSYAFGSTPPDLCYGGRMSDGRMMPIIFHRLHCVCAYPTPIEQANLGRLRGDAQEFEGISDHTTSVLTGALAVAAGGFVIEKHVRLSMTPTSNPDYPHSLDAELLEPEPYDCPDIWYQRSFACYVHYIREAERAMGTGENVMQECERVNLGRRVKA